MKIELISHHDANRKLILVFAGWGSDAQLYTPIADLDREGWDVMVVHSFSHRGIEDKSDQLRQQLRSYDSVYLFAWSLGVAAAEYLLSDIDLQGAFAFNGTLTPVSDQEGIPVAVFRGTADNLNLRNLMKFRRRMASSASHYASFSEMLPQNPDIEQLRAELQLFEMLSEHNSTHQSSAGPKGIGWTRAYISAGDAIFPSAAQQKSWSRSLAADNIVVGEGAHYVSLADYVATIVPDLKRVGNSFAQAVAFYDGSASPQRMIAERLGAMVAEAKIPQNSQVMEIGPGTGLFTREYAPVLRPQAVSFLELYDIPAFEIAPSEHYITGDAERWIAEHKEDGRSYDAILSASVIQWFSDPASFFANASKLLKEDGVLICSTFLPGTLGELDAVRPSPLIYREAEVLLRALEENFERVEVCDEIITVHFATAREALMHLRHTGVSGIDTIDPSTGTSPTARALLAALTPQASLSYRPLYIRASHPRV